MEKNFSFFFGSYAKVAEVMLHASAGLSHSAKLPIIADYGMLLLILNERITML